MFRDSAVLAIPVCARFSQTVRINSKSVRCLALATAL